MVNIAWAAILALRKLETREGDSTMEDTHFVDSANGNKLVIVKTAIINM